VKRSVYASVFQVDYQPKWLDRNVLKTGNRSSCRRQGAHLRLIGLWVRRWYTMKCVMHSQCSALPTVTFLASGASLQTILLADRGMCARVACLGLYSAVQLWDSNPRTGSYVWSHTLRSHEQHLDFLLSELCLCIGRQGVALSSGWAQSYSSRRQTVKYSDKPQRRSENMWLWYQW